METMGEVIPTPIRVAPIACDNIAC
jgi:hypothetical protein